MRIAHVVTYVSPDGAFGGPTRVALGQAAALAERGHAVTVYAAAPPQDAGTTHQDGYTLKTFPGRRVTRFGGFASLCAPALSRSLRRHAGDHDIAHVHLARDLVTLPAARILHRAGVPFVAQTHGMIDASERMLAKPLDALMTRPLLRQARAVLTLTDREDDDLAAVEPAVRTKRVVNGVRIGELAPYDDREDLVLFLARLHPRKRPMAFVEMARSLKDILPHTRFVLAGPDEGEGEAVRAAISAAGMGDRLAWVGPVTPDRTDDLFASARVYVLPAFDEVFPMTILESLRVGTPVVTTRSLGLVPACERWGAALITDGSPRELAEAVTSILASPELPERLRAGGHALLRQELDIGGVTEHLESIYRDARSGCT